MQKHHLLALGGGALLLLCAAMPQRTAAQNAEIDAAMSRLFRTAEAHNATLAACRAAISESDAAIDAAKANRLPDVTGQVAFSYNGDARIWDRKFRNGVKAEMPHFGNNYALMASQVVYAGGAVDAGIRLSEQAARLTRLTAREQQERVRFSLAGLYLQLHHLVNCERVYRKNAALADEQIKKMTERREQGTALRNDITRYELQREQTLLGASSAADRSAILRHRLTTALGTDSAVALLPTEAFDEADLSRLNDVTAWQQTAQGGHVALERDSLAVDMSLTKERIERAARRPKVALVAEDHLDGPLTFEVPPLNKNLNYWFVGVGITYNFSSLYKNNRSVRRARLATETARARLDETRAGISDNVQQAYIDCLTAQTELRTQQKSVELAEQNYNVVARRYDNGLALVTDLTDAANVKLDAELALANARINLVYCYYALRYAAGDL